MFSTLRQSLSRRTSWSLRQPTCSSSPYHYHHQQRRTYKKLVNLERLLKQDKYHLSKAITLLESSLPLHQEQSAQLLQDIIAANDIDTKKEKERPTFRIGITGPPGAGKSTFIESLGMYILEKDPLAKLVVLTIDPSSHLSGGSILGDKTRMEQLSLHPRAMIRATPTKGQLGGLAYGTAEVMRLCELVGYNYTIVETVGVGQSELDVFEVADIMALLVIINLLYIFTHVSHILYHCLV